MNYKRVLIIAGSDSGGGAGIQADLKTVSACGAYAATAITAITVQNTMGVTGIHAIPTSIIQGQIRAVLDDIGADAIKIGMLHSVEVIRGVAETLSEYPEIPVILDPVMVSTSGHRLMEEDAVECLKQKLIPRALIITPNLPEAEVLLNQKITSLQDMEHAAQALSMNSKVSVYLKAGHWEGDILTDFFYNAPQNRFKRIPASRFNTPNTHGTGCTLSSALAAFVARGASVEEAAIRAKEYIAGAIEAGAAYTLGRGHGPVHHFYQYWK